MKITALSILAVVWPMMALGQETPASLDNSEVRISYAELKRLLEAARPAPMVVAEPRKPVPPVAATLVSARYQVKAQTGTILVELEVENFDGGWHAVPVEWSIRMPDGFDLSVAGNVDVVMDGDAAKDSKPPELRLRKALCRDQQPQARITYRRR